jgi:hypothetical protein
MSKSKRYLVWHEVVPEWGLSPYVSTAVPIAVSGAEIKSTKDASEAMYTVLRSKADKGLIAEIRKLARGQKSKQSYHPANFFASGGRAPRLGVGVGRKRR